MFEAVVGIPGIGVHVYQNMVCRYRVCVEVVGCYIELFLQVDAEEKQLTVSSRSARVQNVMWWYFVCSREAVCFQKWSFYAKLNCFGPHC